MHGQVWRSPQANRVGKMPLGVSVKGDNSGFVGEQRTGSPVGLGGQGLTSNIDCLFLDLNTCWLEGSA